MMRACGKISLRHTGDRVNSDICKKTGKSKCARIEATPKMEGGTAVEININEQSKIVEVWQSHVDQQDEALQSRLRSMYADWKKKKYLVAVYRSGKEDMYEATRDLLIYNKRRTAELAVRREKLVSAKAS